MGDCKTTDKSLQQLEYFLTKEMQVDIPLYFNNPERSLRISLETQSLFETKKLALEIITSIFGDAEFWMCEYGSDTGKTFEKYGILKSISDVSVIPYYSELIDRDDYEYECDAISCIKTSLNEADKDAYIDYCFRLDWLSNSIYLVSLLKKCTVMIYAPHMMDIASTDNGLLQELRDKYGEYIMDI